MQQADRDGHRDAILQPQFIEDLRYWIETDRRTVLRLLTLMESILRDPYAGIGNPEPLRYRLAGAWSRRLTHEHRVGYLIADDHIDFLQGRYHY